MINATGNRMTMEIRRQSALAQQISDTQITISTGRRIQRGSDDPVAASRVANIRQAQADNVTWKSNLILAGSLAGQADGVLQNMASRMTRAQELIIAGTSGTVNASDRATMALELNGIATELDSYAGTTSALGNALFTSGNALEIRFGASATFAPVPSSAEVFTLHGTALSQIVRNAAAAVSTGDVAARGQSLSAIQNAVGHVADVAADIGVRGARIDRMREALELSNVEHSAERSQLEDTDLSEAIARLNAQTLTLEAAQSAFARINRRSLFDILG
jgi:flagellar hook-associated protein 3 FlgL